MRVAVFIGTRPEAIKMAPVIRALEAHGETEPYVVSTGQHREMLAQVIDLFGLPVHEDLGVMTAGQTLAGLSARLMAGVDGVLERAAPDISLVQGDTTTVLMAALASFYRRIPVGHVEAGLRTGNIASPFPEEANRRLAAPIVDMHFAPTQTAADNLIGEGIDPAEILVTGNTVVDALYWESQRQDEPEVARAIEAQLGQQLGSGWREQKIVLVTGHRRENFGSGFEEICRALRALSQLFPDHRFVYPVHLNPRVQQPVMSTLAGLDNVSLLDPMGYRPFVALMKHCKLVLTDSGGVQEEAPSLGKPVLVMRDTTERPEGVQAGTVKLVGAVESEIVRGVSGLLSDPEQYRAMSEAHNPYGDGKAAGRIVERIVEFHARRTRVGVRQVPAGK